MAHFDLQRFVQAQDPIYDKVRAELAAGVKASHWMWFVFPQITGLGSSAMSTRYAISSIEEAKAYHAHPLLGERLRVITEAMNNAAPNDPAAILGPIDAIKFQSSATLFEFVSADQKCFRTALDKFFAGRPDEATVRQIAIWQNDIDG